MKFSLILTILTTCSLTQIALPEKIQNIEDLKKLAEEGDSNAQCLLGLQEMIGGDLYDPRIIDTVTVEQILLNKVDKWADLIRNMPSFEKGSEFETGSKTEEAFKWVKKSAQQGNKIGLYCLGMFYGTGMGVRKDYDQAYYNFEKSAKLGFLRSYRPAGQVCAQKGEMKQMAEWYWRGYDAGDLDCKVEVGAMFLYGVEGAVSKNEIKGFQHIEEAYQAGNKTAIWRLGQCYMEGLGTSKNLYKAFDLFKEGSSNDTSSKFLLGQMYLNGWGTEKDERVGLALIEEAASFSSSPVPKFALGKAHANGWWGVRIDYAKAVNLIEQSALEGHPEAMLELGKAYYFGTIVKGDKELAKKWLQKAKDRGSKEAGELLKKIEAQEKR